MNNCVIMGRMTSDPELKTTAGGVSVSSFTVAVERNFTKDSDRQTDFLTVVTWRGLAEFVTKYFRKGQMIAVVGSIQNRNWEDKNGNNRISTEIVADNAYFCGPKSEEDKKSINIPEFEYD